MLIMSLLVLRGEARAKQARKAVGRVDEGIITCQLLLGLCSACHR